MRSALASALLIPVIVALTGSACAPRKALAPKVAAQNPSIQRLLIGPFRGEGGPAVVDELVRQLNAAHISVVKDAALADAVLTGTVVDYHPAQKRTVFLGPVQTVGTDGQLNAVTSPVISLGGPRVIAPAGSADQVLGTDATITVEARLTRGAEFNVIWTMEVSDVAYDIGGADQAVVQRLTAALLPSLKATRSTAL